MSKEHKKSHNKAESGEVDFETEINSLLQELLQEEFHLIIDSYIQTNLKFTIDKIDRAPILSDRFVYPNFNKGLLKKCFTKETCILVSQHIKTKESASICPVCSDICLEFSIKCYYCEKW